MYVGATDVPLTSKCYWEYLSEAGDNVAIIGVPLNIPPREVNGHLIAGGPYADPDDYTYPASLQDTLESKFNYQLHPKVDPPSVEDPTTPEIVDDLEAMIHQRFDVATWLKETESPSLLNLTLFYINHLQHKAWDDDAVKQLWMTVDHRLSELIENGDDVIIHSDHGLAKTERVFYLNGWLRREGYLQLHDDTQVNNDTTAETSDGDSGLDWTDLVGHAWDTGRSTAQRLEVDDLLGNLIPDRIRESIPNGDSSGQIVDASSFEQRIDFEASDAVALPHGLIYVLTDDDARRDELTTALATVNDDQTETPVFTSIEPAEDIYSDPIPQDAPDLIARWTPGFEIKDINATDETRVFGPPQKFRADNRPDGTLIASGPRITTEIVTNSRLIDLAPTLLHLHGVPIPDDLDGVVLDELYAPGSTAATTTPKTIPGGEVHGNSSTSESVENRLQELGYLE